MKVSFKLFVFKDEKTKSDLIETYNRKPIYSDEKKKKSPGFTYEILNLFVRINGKRKNNSDDCPYLVKNGKKKKKTQKMHDFQACNIKSLKFETRPYLGKYRVLRRHERKTPKSVDVPAALRTSCPCHDGFIVEYKSVSCSFARRRGSDEADDAPAAVTSIKRSFHDGRRSRAR